MKWIIFASKCARFMVYSMTGYGQNRKVIRDKNYLVEIRTLNGRTTDLRLKIPSFYREMEPQIREVILSQCIRGKMDFFLNINGEVDGEDYTINTQIFEKYYAQIKEISNNLNIPISDPITGILRLPNAYQPAERELDDGHKDEIMDMVQAALNRLDDFRKEEGDAMKMKLENHVSNIASLRDECVNLSLGRKDKIRQKIKTNLDSLDQSIKKDENRLEQELIYYIEKFDFTEEIERLEQHCKYFSETLNNSDKSKGKKLNFIGQEIGREINTLGSKAQDAVIQRKVVDMKDELEKIKEQLANIL